MISVSWVLVIVLIALIIVKWSEIRYQQHYITRSTQDPYSQDDLIKIIQSVKQYPFWLTGLQTALSVVLFYGIIVLTLGLQTSVPELILIGTLFFIISTFYFRNFYDSRTGDIFSNLTEMIINPPSS